MTDCPHDWATNGPFYATVALEVTKRCQQDVVVRVAPVPIEHCRLCGVLRLPPGLWWQDGSVADRPRSILGG